MVGSQPGNGLIHLGWQCFTLRPDGLPCDFKGGFNAQSAPRSLRASGIFETASGREDDDQLCKQVLSPSPSRDSPSNPSTCS